ncbi:MAG: hypothetical protein IPK87_05505 [Planctomycetes bacterium]|nr:hypothetical protein [Planctomycetota bacterium]
MSRRVHGGYGLTLTGMQLVVACPNDASSRWRCGTVLSNTGSEIVVDDPSDEIHDAIENDDLSFVVYDLVDKGTYGSATYHTAGEWTSTPSYASSETTFTDSGATFDSDMIGWLLVPTAGESSYLEITAVPSATTVKVKGDARGLSASGNRYWVIAPAGVEFANGTVRLTKAYGSNYLYAGYRWQAPMTGFYLDPPGLDGLDTYGAQSGANLAGWHHAGHRVYDPGVQGRWTTPDPAESPWTNLMDYCANRPTSVTDGSGLKAYNLDWDHFSSAKRENRGCRGFKWKIKWLTKGHYSHPKFRKGEQWIVQRMHIEVTATNCDTDPTNDGHLLLPDDYLEAWKVKYRRKGWTYKPQVDGSAADTWFYGSVAGNCGRIIWRGDAIWAKEKGPGGWARGGGFATHPWGTLHGTRNNIDEKWQRFRWADKRSGVKQRDYVIDYNCP